MNVGGSTCLAFTLTVCSSQFACAAADYPPAEDDGRTLVATIFGRQVFADEPAAKRLFSEVSRSAHREYAVAKKLTPTREQLTKIFSDTIARHPELLKDEEAERNTAIRLFWLRGASLDWIVAKALYEEYGGSIATSSFGACTSITGRNAIIKQYVKSGDIQFHQPKVEGEFWERLKSKRVLDTTITDPKRIKQSFAVPPWRRWIEELGRGPEPSKAAKASK